ncbi:MAG TPA: NAD-dependent epimerase/dehydratase family protein [Candidatus Eisenbacteria bacterium]|nr:NAD-dependent epimerase/dehydratase family protein [Candidatus Eisenbacteria bacterium]
MESREGHLTRKQAFVTGGAGFIGSNIVRKLVERGWFVRILDDLSTGYRENLEALPKDSLELVPGDVRDAQAVLKLSEGCQAVFHLAASVGNIKSIEQPRFDAEVNVLGTLSVLEAVKAHRVKLVYSSSAAIFGEVVYVPLDEAHPAEPDSPYGVTKLAAEKHCLAYARLFDLDIVCLRYFNVYGVNQRYDVYGNVIPIWTRRLLDGEPLIIYGDGDQTRDFINVEDVAEANVMAAESQGVRGAFNIGTGAALTINQLADAFRKVGGQTPHFENRPPRKGEVKHSQAKVDRARETFGFRARVAIEPGLVDYVAWIRDGMPSRVPATGGRS